MGILWYPYIGHRGYPILDVLRKKDLGAETEYPLGKDLRSEIGILTPTSETKNWKHYFATSLGMQATIT